MNLMDYLKQGLAEENVSYTRICSFRIWKGKEMQKNNSTRNPARSVLLKQPEGKSLCVCILAYLQIRLQEGIFIK